VSSLPATAAWQHAGSRTGFEVVFLRRRDGGVRLEGYTAGIADDEPWGIRYELVLDPSWATRSAHIVGRSRLGAHELRIECDGRGAWSVDGAAAPELDGCLDVDLEASACTNALPVNRLELDVGQRADAPAAWVRASGLRVERLEQSYTRLADDDDRARYDYIAPALEFRTIIVFDAFGLALDYPEIAVRVA
jgi:uncharacterized protein